MDELHIVALYLTQTTIIIMTLTLALLYATSPQLIATTLSPLHAAFEKQPDITFQSVSCYDMFAVLEQGNMQVMHNSEPFSAQVIYPRVFSAKHAPPILTTLESQGCLFVNSRASLVSAGDKWTTSSVLASHNIAVPEQVFVSAAATQSLTYAADVFGFPMVLKTPTGFGGSGVFLVNDTEELLLRLEELNAYKHHAVAIVQPFYASAQGSDIRIIVIGEKILTSVRRTAPEGDFRANASIGGAMSPHIATDVEKQMAIAATKALNLDVAGVDIIYTPTGPVVLEVNATPGLVSTVGVIGEQLWDDFAYHITRLAHMKAKT